MKRRYFFFRIQVKFNKINQKLLFMLYTLKFSICNNIQTNRIMQNRSTNQISSNAEDQKQVVIFDQDYWNDEKNTKDTSKSLCDIERSSKDNLIANQITDEIKNTKENFYKIAMLKPCEDVVDDKCFQNMRNPHSIIREGFLKKKTDGFFFTWRTRFMVLTPEKLYSFEDSKKEKAIGCVNLKILSSEIKQTSEGLILDFHGQCQNLILQAQGKADLQKWKQSFKQVLDYHSKQSKVMLKTMNRFIYEQKDTLTERQFLKQAETGDVLLFYTDNFGAKVQRALTNSDFDHVAMVVKLKKKDLMVFESNQLHGVSIYNWTQYIKFFDLYGKVTLRKLKYIRKAEAQTNLLQFMKKNLGKKYDIGALKLMKFQSDFNWQDVKEQRGYFCSELVAKALKSIGLLDEKKSCGRYWPVDFSQKNNLELKKGASLGSELTIVLNKHTKNQI